MQFYKRLRHSLGSLAVSVRSQYGGGGVGYIKWFFYSFLAINTFIVFSKGLSDESGSRGEPDGAVFVDLTLPKLDFYRKYGGFPKEFYADALGGKRCHGVVVDGQLAYIHWIYDSDKASRFLRFSDKVVEINYIATLKPYRGKRICPWALSEAFRVLAAEGKRKIVAVVHSKNVASIKVMESLGMKDEAYIKSLGPFNFRKTIRS